MEEIYGWTGRFLRVDLTHGKIEVGSTSLEELKKYLGGSGLAGDILYREVPPDINALDPENRVILSVGPLVGTLAPCSGRATLTSKSPMTGIFGDSSVGGTWGAQMKWAGWDYIIIQGKSPHPVYLWITNDGVEVRDAGHLWGKDTWITDRMIKSELGDNYISVACIGPAGENLSLAGCVIVDCARAWGRCSYGAVLGSKKVKAIAVKGTKGVKVAKPKEFEELCWKMNERIKTDPTYGPVSRYGTVFWQDALHAAGYESWGYYQCPGHSGRWQRGEEVGGEAFWSKAFTKSKACFNCPLHCGHYSHVKDGLYAGEKGGGPEYNAVIEFGCHPLIDDPAFIVKCNNICNRLGAGVDEVGAPIAFAMLLFEKGIINKEDTEGLEITYGNKEVVLKLIEQICYREGFGDILADGAKKAAEKIGRAAEKYAMHIKGLDLVGELRYPLGCTLGWTVASRGADYCRGAPIFELVGPPIYPEEIKREMGRNLLDSENAFLDTHDNGDGKAKTVIWYEHLCAVINALGLCMFVSFWAMPNGYQGMDLAKILSFATGVDFTAEELMKIGEGIIAVERAYNAREGICRKDDYPPHVFFQVPEEVSLPPKKVAHNITLYDKILTEYYGIRGYDAESGIPKKERLIELALEHIAKDLAERKLIED